MKLPHPPTSCRVYTPPSLARAIVGSLGDEPQLSWLEPSHGKGAFVNAISNLGVARERIIAVDLDRTISEADTLATTFRGVDFLRWAAETSRRFDRIVGNPPYISIERLPFGLQHTASSILDLNEQPIGRGANVWYAFVLSSIRLLNPGGSFGFVLPSAAEFANYSAEMRSAVRKRFSSVEICRCKRPLFSGVKEGSVVVIARDLGSRRRLFRRRAYTTPAALMRGLCFAGGSALSGELVEGSPNREVPARQMATKRSLRFPMTEEIAENSQPQVRCRDLSKPASSLVESGG